MRDVLGPGTMLGYCTNVHPRIDNPEAVRHPIEHALDVKRCVSPDEPMGIGWWVQANAAHALAGAVGASTDLQSVFHTDELVPFTFNGFPYGDFHQTIVKHSVYEPDWTSLDRAAYTKALAYLHTRLAEPPCERSISTLPLGWGKQSDSDAFERMAAIRLVEIVQVLRRLDEAGYFIHVDLEPEPGCLLQRSGDIVRFFEGPLRRAADALSIADHVIRRHVRVCHDICHAAVMHEDQADVLERYRASGIKVGKVQISSALMIEFNLMSAGQRRQAFEQLGRFVEERYLHQTTILMPDGSIRFFDDLPVALGALPAQQVPGREWRVHFHVPIFLDRAGDLSTTQSEIQRCLVAIRPEDDIHHFEVETYAWNVLPPELRTDDLAEGIARELLWVKELARELKE